MGGPETSKNRAAERLGAVLRGSWGNLGASWALLEAFWASWRGLGGILGGTWSILEGFWSLVGVFWAHHGASWESLGSVLGGLGGFQRPCWKHFWRISVHLKQFMKIAKNLGKPMVFHWFSRFWKGSGFQKSPKNHKKIEVCILRGQKIPKMATWGAKNAILQRKLEPRGRFWRPKTTQTRKELKKTLKNFL